MPKELTGTTSPQRIPETISREESNRLKDLYGHDNWYDWCYRNWGTKWGCYDNHYDEVQGTLHFATAWSPFNFDVLDLLTKKLPDFIWTWEEEQGFGEEEEYQDGECIRSFSWDLPEISEDIVEVDYLTTLLQTRPFLQVITWLMSHWKRAELLRLWKN